MPEHICHQLAEFWLLGIFMRRKDLQQTLILTWTFLKKSMFDVHLGTIVESLHLYKSIKKRYSWTDLHARTFRLGHSHWIGATWFEISTRLKREWCGRKMWVVSKFPMLVLSVIAHCGSKLTKTESINLYRSDACLHTLQWIWQQGMIVWTTPMGQQTQPCCFKSTPTKSNAGEA